MTVRPRRPARRDLRGVLIGLVSAVVFVFAVLLVILNQQTVGWVNLGLMLLGLTTLIVLLALYNRRYR